MQSINANVEHIIMCTMGDGCWIHRRYHPPMISHLPIRHELRNVVYYPHMLKCKARLPPFC